MLYLFYNDKRKVMFKRIEEKNEKRVFCLLESNSFLKDVLGFSRKTEPAETLYVCACVCVYM